MSRLCDELQQRWHNEIPISAAMQIKVRSFEDHTLHIEAALGPNVNVHGTGFAGSLYSIAALCGWGATHLALVTADRGASIVIANAQIDYRAPVTETITARCHFPYANSLANLAAGDKARFDLTVQIGTPDAAPNNDKDKGKAKAKATFSGTYAVRLPN